MRPTLEQYRLNGTGSKGSLCLLFVNECGIGDDVNALPVVASLAEENDVTVYTVHPELWRGIDVNVIGVTGNQVVGFASEYGELLDILWDGANLPKYETIYKLTSWGVWEDNEIGGSIRPRFDQLAEILGVECSHKYAWGARGHNPIFDYAAALNARKIDVEKPYVVLSVESHEPMRTLPDDKAFELYVDLLNYSDVIWLTEGSPQKRRTRCSSLAELIHLVYNAERVVGIDNGIAHIAAALRKPLTLIGGMTDVRKIFEQYQTPINYIQTAYTAECPRACYRLPSNGFTKNKCCGSHDAPKCLGSTDVGRVVSIAYGDTANAFKRNFKLTTGEHYAT